MPTELLTLNQARAQQRSETGEVTQKRTLPSHQKETIKVDDCCFGDFLQALNPLNHIPVISSLTNNNAAGEKQNAFMPVAKIVSGGLLGGVIGLVGAAVDSVFEQANGKSFLASVTSGLFESETSVEVASNSRIEAYKKAAAIASKKEISAGSRLSIEG